MRNVHGIYGGVTGIRRKRGRPVGSKNVPQAKRETDDSVVIEQPKKLPPLTADQITRAAAESLWPRGIPHDKLAALLRWNNQTYEFLTEVSQ